MHNLSQSSTLSQSLSISQSLSLSLSLNLSISLSISLSLSQSLYLSLSISLNLSQSHSLSLSISLSLYIYISLTHTKCASSEQLTTGLPQPLCSGSMPESTRTSTTSKPAKFPSGTIFEQGAVRPQNAVVLASRTSLAPTKQGSHSLSFCRLSRKLTFLRKRVTATSMLVPPQSID